MVDLRYHITSLVAVFLALGIGIVVGSTVVGSEGLLSEQQVLIDRLENDFFRLRQENSQYKMEISEFELQKTKYQQFAADVFAFIAKDSLQGKKILMVKTGDFPEIEQLARELEFAGAAVEIIAINREMPGIEKLLAAAENQIGDFWNQIGSYISQDKNTDFGNRALETMREQGVLGITGFLEGAPDAVILAGGSSIQGQRLFQKIDGKLISALKQHDVPVVGVEFTTAALSYIKDYQSLGISTVDNADTYLGKLALVKVLCGYTGNYGVKQTADAIMPPLSPLEQQTAQ